jgi:hemolysin III
LLSKFNEPVNGFTHLLGAVVSAIGLLALIVIGWNDSGMVISVIIYGFSLIAMFSASAAYHLLKERPKVQQTLRKLDHSAIFLLIAGTYTPFCMIAFTGFWRWGLFAIIWGIAIVGIVVKIISIRAPRWANALIYVIMGWLCVMAAPQMPSVLPVNVIIWLVIGGVIYTLGAVVYATKIFNFVPGKFGFHEVWHIFVLFGALAHFISIFSLVVSRATV